MNNYTTEDVERFWSKVDLSRSEEDFACWMWTASSAGPKYKEGRGYGQIVWGGKLRHAHRIVYHIAFGDYPQELHVCHHCDNPMCVNPNHLFLGTRMDNFRDMMDKGRHNPGQVHGEKHGNAKLSDAQVAEIRRRYDTAPKKYGMQLKLAKEFGVAQDYIWMLVHRTERI